MRTLIINMFIFSLIIFLAGCSNSVSEDSKDVKEEPGIHPELKLNSNYYWYSNEKVPLEKYPNKLYIVFETEKAENIKTQLNNEGIILQDEDIRKGGDYFKEYFELELSDIIISADRDIEYLIDKLDIIYGGSYFKTEFGHEIGAGQFFYVKLKKEKDIILLESMAAKTNTKILTEHPSMPLWHTLCCSKLSKGNSLEMANLFFESGNFSAAQPDFIGSIVLD